MLASIVMGLVSPWQPKAVPLQPGNKGLRPDALPAPKQLATTEWPVIRGALDWLKKQEIIDTNGINSASDLAKARVRAALQSLGINLDRSFGDEIAASVALGEGRGEWADRITGLFNLTRYQAEVFGRTLTHNAYHAGLQAIVQSPVVKAEFPYMLYSATQDGRVRDTHWDMDGKVAHVDSPLAEEMRTLTNQWQCRCVLISLSRSDALARGIDDDTGWVEPPPEESLPPPEADDGISAIAGDFGITRTY